MVADRLCQVRKSGAGLTDGPPLDEHNFLASSAVVIQDISLSENGVLADPAMLAQAGAFVLLGEPGIGKSTTLRKIGLAAGEVVELDGADITTDSFKELVESPIEQFFESRATSAQPDPQKLTMIIDQVDECPIATRLGPRLRQVLRRTGTTNLRLLVACRTADLPTSLVEALQQSFGDCQIADLVPLSYREAERLVLSDSTIDGAKLLARVIDVGAGLLASVPLTLGFLADEFRQTGDVVGSVADLFADGTTRLLDEPNADRRAGLLTSLSQRKAIAGRLAALLLLSGRRTLWTGEALGGSTQDVDVNLACGGDEAADGQPFELTPRAISETRSSAVFTGRGEKRISFLHGSISAYLNAALLVSRAMPVSQLRSLFFVPVGTDRYAIPTALQESAAWLIHLCPDHGDWIATADPESLMAYSKIVDSANVRKTLVAALLTRAGEVELTNRPWSRRTPSLDHPGLVDQLRVVIGQAGEYSGSWDDLARVRLAVELARAASVGGLRSELLALLSDRTWPAHVRQLAALAAFNGEPDAVAAELKAFILDFEDAEFAAEIDPDQEILGSVLKVLWPTHLGVDEALRLMHPKLRRDLFGVYRAFLGSFPTTLNETDLGTVLDWAGQKRTRPRRPKHVPSDVVELGDDPIGEIDIELVVPLVNRYFEISSSATGMATVARLLYEQLVRHDSPPLPFPLARVDSNSNEDPDSRAKRRALALELSTIPTTFDRSDAWAISWSWGHPRSSYIRSDGSSQLWEAGDRRVLLDGLDFRWAYDLCGAAFADGQLDRADRLSTLAALIIPPDDRESFELLVDDPAHPVSQKLRYLYEAVDIDGPVAEQLRQTLGFTNERNEAPSWPGHADFVGQLRASFDSTLSGDVDSFWVLLRRLQFDPQTGHGDHGFCDELAELPGWSALLDHTPEELLDAALEYVSSSSDHGEEWLGTDRMDFRACAGYQALAAIARAGRIGEVAASSWKSWTSAIVWFWTIPMECGDPELKAQLLSIASREAPETLVDSLERYVQGELSRGQSPSEVEVIAGVDDSPIRKAMLRLLVEILDAIYAWKGPEEEPSDQPVDLDELPNRQRPPVGQVIQLPRNVAALDAAYRTFETVLEKTLPHMSEARSIVEALMVSAAQDAPHASVAVAAVHIALSAEAGFWWPAVMNWLHDAGNLSRQLCLKCAASHDWKPFIQDLEEDGVAEVFRWINNEFPPASDVTLMGAHMVGPEEQAQHWRRGVLSHLAARGTPGALKALEGLERAFPDDLSIAAATVSARSLVAEVAWRPPSPSDVLALLSNSRRRLVRTDGELANVLIEVLQDIQLDLPGHGQLLWDGIPDPTVSDGRRATRWRPKPEAALCAYLTHEVRVRLGGQNVFVNREVMVRPTDEYGAGERTDMLVQAVALKPRAREEDAAAATVVIEVKGSWNKGLAESQRTQLADRYMPSVQSTAGIYLVGWFPPSQWDDSTDTRRPTALRLDKQQVAADLLAQAGEIRSSVGVQTIPILLEVPRPTKVVNAVTTG